MIHSTWSTCNHLVHGRRLFAAVAVALPVQRTCHGDALARQPARGGADPKEGLSPRLGGGSHPTADDDVTVDNADADVDELMAVFRGCDVRMIF